MQSIRIFSPKQTFVIWQFFAFIFLICGCTKKDYPSQSKPVSYTVWNDLLHDHVDRNGRVDYIGFMKDSLRFNSFLNLLKQNHPNNKNWSRSERLAYWINAYNAFTIKIITDHYPLESIKDIRRGIPFVNTTWDIKFIKIEKRMYSLNNIEHGIIRPKFKDPRVHFALNCASVSCPKLRNEAYTSEMLESQLDDQVRSFLTDPDRNKITESRAELSEIFKWYRIDFKKKGGILAFINNYSLVKINKKTTISHLDYDWSLNSKK